MKERDRRSRSADESRPRPEQPPQGAMPWSVPVTANDIPETGRHFDLIADAATREAIARAADVAAVEGLEATFDLAPFAREGIRVTGTVSGRVVQTCVVTLDPLASDIEEEVDMTFLPPGAVLSPELAARFPADEDSDPPEELENGTLDLGRVAVEFLILGIDPYPRKPGVSFEAPKVASDPAEHPFAALAKLKKDSGSKPG